MSSYRGETGAWDGGPPGAEADYAPQPGPPNAAPLPTTDPWTGVSYSQYGQPQYDYQGYSAPGYGYSYDQSYYSRTDSRYYDNNSRSAYPPQQQDTFDYQTTPYEQSSSFGNKNSDCRKRSYNSPSVSPNERRERESSRSRDISYENARRRRSRSVSEEKRTKYSSSDRSSSRSRSYSRLSKKKKKRSRSASSDSYVSRRSSRKATSNKNKQSMTPPLKKKGSRPGHRSGARDSVESFDAKLPKIKREVESKDRAIMKETKAKDKKRREISTPPRKVNMPSPREQRKSDRSVTPPKSYKRGEKSPIKSDYKGHKSKIPPKKSKHGSVTPPRCYARSRSLSRSASSSFTPEKRKNSPKSRKSRSSSYSSRYSRSSRSRSKSQRLRRKSQSKDRSRSKSQSRGSIRSQSRSSGRSIYRDNRSSSKGSRSRSPMSRSHSHSTESEDARRGQFTVADRKRFWKMHRSKQGQERTRKVKTPPKEVKPPPGAVESTNIEGIEYGDPPEVEGPNFADLLPPPDQAFAATTSKSKSGPIPIKNDGSFLEMFKKMQEATKKVEEPEKKPEIKKPVLPFIGKRRGGRVLKTGLVKKAKAIDEQTVDNTPKDAWSLYMQEVKKYRETSCEEERKTRPLVK